MSPLRPRIASCAVLVLVCAAGLGVAAEARAETWSLLAGSVTLDASGEITELSGSFDADLFVPRGFPEPTAEPLPGPAPDVLLVEDFALQAGEQSFGPALPVEFDGLVPILHLRIADQIHVDGEQVGLVRLRAGGEVVDFTESQVTFRFTEFRGATAGRASGEIGDGSSGLPRLLEIEGKLHEVDQTFAILRDAPCTPFPLPPPQLPPPPGGGVLGGGSIILHQTLDLEADATVEIAAPPDAGEIVFVPATGEAPPVPTLEELGITAPDGAEVTFDAEGALTVRSDGDLFVDGGFPDVPGLTSLTLVAEGDIIITGSFEIPPDVEVHIDAGGVVDIGDGVAGPVEPPIVGTPLCDHLRALFPLEEREVGSYSLIATAATPAAIDVQPWRARNRVLPGARRRIAVALLGSDQLDTRDVDPHSLRLGPGEAEPLSRRDRVRFVRLDVNRDRRVDLLAAFDVRDIGISYRDTTLCMLAETYAGEQVEGCDAIQTLRERISPP